MTLEERITRLEDIEEIRRLQARYQRMLDSRCFDELAACFTEDAVSSYGNDSMSYKGRDNIIQFLMSVMTVKMPSSHLIHGGEIDWRNPEKASGIWYLEDHLLLEGIPLKIHGTAVYHVEYRKEKGNWLISAIGYERNYEYFEFRGLMNLLTLKKKTLLEKIKRGEKKDVGPYGKTFYEESVLKKKKTTKYPGKRK